MPTFSIPGAAGSIHVVDLREESPSPSGSLPIVFVHGMVGHTGFWNTALAACADRRRAIAVDLRGHGSSSAPSDGDFSVSACAGDVLAVVDHLGLDAIVLVGHSYGAIVAIEVASQRPGLVRRLVLADPPGDFTRLSQEVREKEMEPFLAQLETDEWRAVVERAFDNALVGGTPAAAASVRARLATMPRETMRGMYRSMFAYPAASALARYLDAPGTSAHAILAPPNAWPFSLHNIEPRLTTTVIPDVGHWIMLDAAEIFVERLGEAIK